MSAARILNPASYSVLIFDRALHPRTGRWLLCALAALLLHFVGLTLRPEFFNPAPPIPIEVGGVDPKELDAIKKQWTADRRFLISNAVKDPNAAAPKNPRFQSSENRTVERETKAKPIYDLAKQGILGAGTRDAGVPAPKPQAIPMAKLSNLSDITNPLRKPAPIVDEETEGNKPGRAGGGATQDIDDNLPVGAENMLNTAESVYHSFYTRMYNSIGPAWMSRIREVAQRIAVKQGEYQTIADIQFDRDGNYIGHAILRSSGIEAFDQAVDFAWKKLPRFPNPPKDLIDQDGVLHMRWSFTVVMDADQNWRYMPPERVE